RPAPGLARPIRAEAEDQGGDGTAGVGRKGRRSEEGLRRRLERDRPGAEDAARFRAPVLPPGSRRCLRQPAFPHRPAPGADGRREGETELREVEGVYRFGAGVAQVSALLAGADPRGTGTRETGRLADVPRGEPRRRTPVGGQGAGRERTGGACG